MKNIITAIGDITLNNLLRKRKDVIVESTDIQYQEGIIEALEKYSDTDIVILSEDIIGDLSLEDLILSITIIKNDIQIILISEAKVELEGNKNIIKIINDKGNYVNIILKYLFDEENIIQEKGNQGKAIMVIGNSGVRKDNFFINTCKINKK